MATGQNKGPRSVPKNKGRRAGGTTARKAASTMKGGKRAQAAAVKAAAGGAGRGLATRGARAAAIKRSVSGKAAARRRG